MSTVLWLVLKQTQRKAYAGKYIQWDLLELKVGKNNSVSLPLPHSLLLSSLVFSRLSFPPLCHSSCWIACTSQLCERGKGDSAFWGAEKVPSDDEQMRARKCSISKLPKLCGNILHFSGFICFTAIVCLVCTPLRHVLLVWLFIGFVLHFYSFLYTGT